MTGETYQKVQNRWEPTDPSAFSDTFSRTDVPNIAISAYEVNINPIFKFFLVNYPLSFFHLMLNHKSFYLQIDSTGADFPVLCIIFHCNKLERKCSSYTQKNVGF